MWFFVALSCAVTHHQSIDPSNIIINKALYRSVVPYLHSALRFPHIVFHSVVVCHYAAFVRSLCSCTVVGGGVGHSIGPVGLVGPCPGLSSWSAAGVAEASRGLCNVPLLGSPRLDGGIVGYGAEVIGLAAETEERAGPREGVM
ncbi:unnamed protein product [Calypogeia fissa]